MKININYQKAIDFEHLDNLDQAIKKLSELTNLLNNVLTIRQQAKQDILAECSKHKGEKLHKLSWDNKMLRLSELSDSTDLIDLWQQSDTAYRQIKIKQEEVYENIMVLKKMVDITPR